MILRGLLLHLMLSHVIQWHLILIDDIQWMYFYINNVLKANYKMEKVYKN